jgi:methyl-accepting chemotaxis protein
MKEQQNRASSPGQNGRRNKWILPELQLKIILMTLSVGTIVLLMNFQVDLLGLSIVYNDPVRSTESTFERIRTAMIYQLGVSFCLAVVLAVWAGAVYAFKFCGPIYRLRRFFQERAEGRWNERCALRKGDDLHDIKDAVNVVMDLTDGVIQRQHALLRESRELLAGGAGADDENSTALDLVRRIDEEAATFERRYGAAEPAREAVPVLAEQS